MSLKNLDILNLYHNLIEEYKFNQLDYSSFKFYVSELRKFDNQITLYDGNTSLPLNKGEQRIIIGTVNKKIFFKLINEFFYDNDLKIISLYLFLISIIDFNIIDKISLNLRFIEEKLNDIRIDISSKYILFINFKNKTIDVRLNEFPYNILSTEYFGSSSYYNRHLDIFKYVINSEIINFKEVDYSKIFNYEEIFNYKKLKTIVNY